MASNFEKRFVERGKKRANISRALEMTRHELNLLEREKNAKFPLGEVHTFISSHGRVGVMRLIKSIMYIY
jgi:hypothetical protein